MTEVGMAAPALSGAAANTALVERVEELEDVIQAKDSRIAELRLELGAVMAQLADQAAELSTARSESDEAKVVVSDLREQLSKLQTSKLVSNLKAQLKAKQQKLRAMEASFAALKEVR